MYIIHIIHITQAKHDIMMEILWPISSMSTDMASWCIWHITVYLWLSWSKHTFYVHTVLQHCTKCAKPKSPVNNWTAPGTEGEGGWGGVDFCACLSSLSSVVLGQKQQEHLFTSPRSACEVWVDSDILENFSRNDSYVHNKKQRLRMRKGSHLRSHQKVLIIFQPIVFFGKNQSDPLPRSVRNFCLWLPDVSHERFQWRRVVRKVWNPGYHFHGCESSTNNQMNSKERVWQMSYQTHRVWRAGAVWAF